jgi:hypothetical protein
VEPNAFDLLREMTTLNKARTIHRVFCYMSEEEILRLLELLGLARERAK